MCFACGCTALGGLAIGGGDLRLVVVDSCVAWMTQILTFFYFTFGVFGRGCCCVYFDSTDFYGDNSSTGAVPLSPPCPYSTCHGGVGYVGLNTVQLRSLIRLFEAGLTLSCAREVLIFVFDWLL